jgi:hypothetical protein
MWYIQSVRRIAASLLRISVYPSLLVAAFAGAVWGLTATLPDPLWIKGAAAVLAVGFAWIHCSVILQSNSNLGDALRALTRIFFTVVWVAFSQHAAGRIMEKTVGGGYGTDLLHDLREMRASVVAYKQVYGGAIPPRFGGLVVSSGTVRMPVLWAARKEFGRKLLPHAASPEVQYFGNEVCRGTINARPAPVMLKDSGHWGYVNDPKSACAGAVFVDCTHVDFRGRSWADY